MKAFSYIFIVYVVFLLTQPCQDLAAMAASVCDADGRNAHIEMLPDETCKDDCVPFCICSCCSHPVGNVVFTLGITDQATIAVMYSSPIEYRNPNAQTYRNSIWQPPKA